MHAPSTCRLLATGAALLFIAGCSGVGSPLDVDSQPGASTQSFAQAPIGFKLVPGPKVAGPILVPILPKNGPGYILPNRRKKVLYVADAGGNDVELYDPETPNPSPIGSITSGIDTPVGLATDNHGTLYVVNSSNATVTEYAAGTTSPSFTITSGMSLPYGIGVTSKGDVFVSNVGTNTVSAYKPGRTSPYATISGVGSNPVGVGVDGKDNVWVCDDSTNTIYIIPKGSTTAQNSGLTALNGPIGISFTTGDTAYVSNLGAPSHVSIYPSGQTVPSLTFRAGITAPTLNGFAKPGTFFQSNQKGDVEGYKAGQTSPFSEISGLSNPLGIASSPKLKP